MDRQTDEEREQRAESINRETDVQTKRGDKDQRKQEEAERQTDGQSEEVMMRKGVRK